MEQGALSISFSSKLVKLDNRPIDQGRRIL
jgi:hypothetical protein